MALDGDRMIHLAAEDVVRGDPAVTQEAGLRIAQEGALPAPKGLGQMFTNSGIFLYQLQPYGAFFKMVRQESFVSGTLPTDVDFGPNGRLYFSDWGTGWAKSKRGRLYALTHRDMVGNALVKETQRLLAEGMSKRSEADTAALLDPSARVAFFAAQGLGKLGRSAATAALVEALHANADRDLYLRHALVMGLLGSGANDALSAAASDASRSVRLGILLAYRRI